MTTISSVVSFIDKHGGDHEEAFACLAGRVAWLMAHTSLSPIQQEQFRMLCELFCGTATELCIDAKTSLMTMIRVELESESNVLDKIEGETFADDTPQIRMDLVCKIEKACNRLVEVAKVIEILDDTQCFVLLERIEEVLNGSADLELEDRCAWIYGKMQAPLKNQVCNVTASGAATRRKIFRAKPNDCKHELAGCSGWRPLLTNKCLS